MFSLKKNIYNDCRKKALHISWQGKVHLLQGAVLDYTTLYLIIFLVSAQLVVFIVYSVDLESEKLR